MQQYVEVASHIWQKLVTSSITFIAVKDHALQSLPLGIMREIWKRWELRLVAVASLSLQFLLVGSGRIRSKYMGPHMLRVSIFAFIIYHFANSAATVVLSILMRGPIGIDKSLATLWTPFFLLHLGSPYNITAYSLEDNDLWRRHLLVAVIQVLQTLYIFIKFGRDYKLKVIAVPVLVAGIIKYGEKIWALRSASNPHLMRYISSSHKIMEIKELDRETVNRYLFSPSAEVRFLRRAYLYFSFFRGLYSELPFHTVRRALLAEIIDTKARTTEEAFRVVETELGFLYDVLYTMIPIQLHRWGLILHIFCFISVVCSAIGFSVLVVHRQYFMIRPGQLLDHGLGRHPITDIFITYMLFSGAIFLDVMSAVVHARSNWVAAKRSSRLQQVYNWLIGLAPLRGPTKPRTRVRRMGQLDLFAYCCLKLSKRRARWLVEILDTENLFGMARYMNWVEVDPTLKKLIFYYLKNKHQLTDLKYFDFMAHFQQEAGTLSSRVPELHEEFMKGRREDFVYCFFVFHIATCLLDYNDHYKYPSGYLGKACEMGKVLSDYMLYLAMVRPFMFPKGVNEQIKDDTDQQARNLCHRRMIDLQSQTNIWKIMKLFTKGLMDLAESRIQVGVPDQPEEVGVRKTESALMDGIVLAKTLQNLVTVQRWDNDDKWELICNLWVRMMVYVAESCPWKEHAKELPNGGGELLTQVSLLLAHVHIKPEPGTGTDKIRPKLTDTASEPDLAQIAKTSIAPNPA